MGVMLTFLSFRYAQFTNLASLQSPHHTEKALGSIRFLSFLRVSAAEDVTEHTLTASTPHKTLRYPKKKSPRKRDVY